MAKITKEDVNKLADLSRIEMTDTEKDEIQKDLESILGYVSEIQEVATDLDDSPEERLDALHNIMREDDNVNEEGVYTDKIITSAPKSEDNYIKVKKIL